MLFPVYAAFSVWQMKETTLWTCCIRTITVCLGSALCVLCKHILNWCNIPVGLWRVEESLSLDKTVNVDMVELTLFCNTFSGPLLFLSAGSGSAYRLTVYSAEIATANDFPQERCLAPCWFFAFYHNCYMLTCCASLTIRVFDSKRRSWWLMISFLLYACSHCLTPPWLKE